MKYKSKRIFLFAINDWWHSTYARVNIHATRKVWSDVSRDQDNRMREIIYEQIQQESRLAKRNTGEEIWQQ